MTAELTENSSGVCTQVGQNRVFPIKQETARFEVDLVPKVKVLGKWTKSKI